MKRTQLAEHRRADLQLERQINELVEKMTSYRIEAAKSVEEELAASASTSLIRLGKKTKDGNVVRV